jgi:hypothetical protein
MHRVCFVALVMVFWAGTASAQTPDGGAWTPPPPYNPGRHDPSPSPEADDACGAFLDACATADQDGACSDAGGYSEEDDEACSGTDDGYGDGQGCSAPDDEGSNDCSAPPTESEPGESCQIGRRSRSRLPSAPRTACLLLPLGYLLVPRRR